jgi:hypothetical protein
MIDQTNAATLNIAGKIISWGVAEAPFPDEDESGDRYVVQPSTDGLLIAAVDGSGHGPEAAAAARIAAATLAAFARESPIALAIRCHEELRRTRGAAMTLASVHVRDRTLTWLGVGNVEAALFHAGHEDAAAPDRALLRAGVVGYHLPILRVEVLPLKPLDTLIMATDGINPTFAEGLVLDGDPQRIADTIFAGYRKDTDDALVIVARYLGDERL